MHFSEPLKLGVDLREVVPTTARYFLVMGRRKESRNVRKGRNDRNKEELVFPGLLIFLSFLPGFGDVATRDVVEP